MRYALASLFVASLLAGSAYAHDAPNFKTTAHTVAIVSVLGNEIDNYNGATAITGAGFDATAEDAMSGQIATDLPGTTVLKIDTSRTALHDQMYPRAGFGDLGMDTVRETLKGWAATHPSDYIVILRKSVGVMEYRGLGLSMNDHYTLFGVSLLRGAPVAFLNLTVCDGKTLQVVADLSVRDTNWGSIAYGPTDPTPEHLPILIDDVKGMLASVVPGLVHGVGM